VRESQSYFSCKIDGFIVGILWPKYIESYCLLYAICLLFLFSGKQKMSLLSTVRYICRIYTTLFYTREFVLTENIKLVSWKVNFIYIFKPLLQIPNLNLFHIRPIQCQHICDVSALELNDLITRRCARNWTLVPRLSFHYVLKFSRTLL